MFKAGRREAPAVSVLFYLETIKAFPEALSRFCLTSISLVRAMLYWMLGKWVCFFPDTSESWKGRMGMRVGMASYSSSCLTMFGVNFMVRYELLCWFEPQCCWFMAEGFPVSLVYSSLTIVCSTWSYKGHPSGYRCFLSLFNPFSSLNHQALSQWHIFVLGVPFWNVLPPALALLILRSSNVICSEIDSLNPNLT